ncbi:MAG: Gfo/Idh/MocA family oxidoreductase [Bacteroidota bacterium]
MTKNKLKIGIVGCGVIADIHAQAIMESQNTELVSAFSRNEKNASTFGEKYKIKWESDWEQFISNPDIDAVSICTPSGNHLDYGEKAAKAGKHVVVEKPIEVTLERAKQLINICKEEGVQLAVIFQSRFMLQIQDLKQKLDDNIIGKLFMGDAYIKWFRSQEYYDSGGWRGTLKLDGGGVLINQSIHTIDLLQWIMGGVESIYGQIGTFTHERLEGEDNAVATLRFKSGAVGVIEGSTSVQPSQSRRLELHGENGSATIDNNSVDIQLANSEDNKENNNEDIQVGMGSSSPLAGFSIHPHKDQFDAIAKAIEKNEIPPVSGEESLKALAIVLAIYESSKTNKPIILDDFIKSKIHEKFTMN